MIVTQDRAVGEGGALYVEMGFYADISWVSKCNIEINVWSHFYNILSVFYLPHRLELLK